MRAVARSVAAARLVVADKVVEVPTMEAGVEGGSTAAGPKRDPGFANTGRKWPQLHGMFFRHCHVVFL